MNINSMDPRKLNKSIEKNIEDRRIQKKIILKKQYEKKLDEKHTQNQLNKARLAKTNEREDLTENDRDIQDFKEIVSVSRYFQKKHELHNDSNELVEFSQEAIEVFEDSCKKIRDKFGEKSKGLLAKLNSKLAVGANFKEMQKFIESIIADSSISAPEKYVLLMDISDRIEPYDIFKGLNDELDRLILNDRPHFNKFAEELESHPEASFEELSGKGNSIFAGANIQAKKIIFAFKDSLQKSCADIRGKFTESSKAKLSQLEDKLATSANGKDISAFIEHIIADKSILAPEKHVLLMDIRDRIETSDRLNEIKNKLDRYLINDQPKFNKFAELLELYPEASLEELSSKENSLFAGDDLQKSCTTIRNKASEQSKDKLSQLNDKLAGNAHDNEIQDFIEGIIADSSILMPEKYVLLMDIRDKIGPNDKLKWIKNELTQLLLNDKQIFIQFATLSSLHPGASLDDVYSQESSSLFAGTSIQAKTGFFASKQAFKKSCAAIRDKSSANSKDKIAKLNDKLAGESSSTEMQAFINSIIADGSISAPEKYVLLIDIRDRIESSDNLKEAKDRLDQIIINDRSHFSQFADLLELYPNSSLEEIASKKNTIFVGKSIADLVNWLEELSKVNKFGITEIRDSMKRSELRSEQKLKRRIAERDGDNTHEGLVTKSLLTIVKSTFDTLDKISAKANRLSTNFVSMAILLLKLSTQTMVSNTDITKLKQMLEEISGRTANWDDVDRLIRKLQWLPNPLKILEITSRLKMNNQAFVEQNSISAESVFSKNNVEQSRRKMQYDQYEHMGWPMATI